jgi:hypothetical protein
VTRQDEPGGVEVSWREAARCHLAAQLLRRLCPLPCQVAERLPAPPLATALSFKVNDLRGSECYDAQIPGERAGIPLWRSRSMSSALSAAISTA